jgi:hypothetical protein
VRSWCPPQIRRLVSNRATTQRAAESLGSGLRSGPGGRHAVRRRQDSPRRLARSRPRLGPSDPSSCPALGGMTRVPRGWVASSPAGCPLPRPGGASRLGIADGQCEPVEHHNLGSIDVVVLLPDSRGGVSDRQLRACTQGPAAIPGLRCLVRRVRTCTGKTGNLSAATASCGTVKRPGVLRGCRASAHDQRRDEHGALGASATR